MTEIPNNNGSRQMLYALKLAVKDAWHVLSLCPDPDARFRASLGGGWCFPVVHDARDAYGASPALSKARPTPQEITRMEIVMGWMAWLRRLDPKYDGGDFAVTRIARWSFGVPIWSLAQRERCSESTLHRRIDRSLANVLKEFLDTPVKIEGEDEPALSQERIRSFTDRPTTGESCELEPGKVFIDGLGFMFHGKQYDPCAKVLNKLGKRNNSA